MQASSAAKPVAVFALLLGVWIVTYWLYEPGPPPISFAAQPAQEPAPRLAVPSPYAVPIQPRLPDPAVRVTAVVPPEFTSYTVEEGDTSLALIAKKTLGHAHYADQIARANPLVSPAKLIPGRTVLKIPVDPQNIQGRAVTIDTTRTQVPDEWQVHAVVIPDPVRQPGPGSSWPMQDSVHEVKPGESLTKISARYYSAPTGYLKIFEANRDQLASPDKLKVGMKLKIPKGP